MQINLEKKGELSQFKILSDISFSCNRLILKIHITEGGMNKLRCFFAAKVWTQLSPPLCFSPSIPDLQGAVSSSLTCLQLHKRAERVAALLMERGGLQEGDHVALVYPPGSHTIHASYLRGCLHVHLKVSWSFTPLLQVLTWSQPSTAACTQAVFPSRCGRLTLRTFQPPCPPWRWSSRSATDEFLSFLIV